MYFRQDDQGGRVGVAWPEGIARRVTQGVARDSLGVAKGELAWGLILMEEG